MKPNTKLVFSETPTNPTLQLVDLDAVSKIAHDNGALHVCDTTFATPYICRPLDHGCDLCIQSLTKFYDSHNMHGNITSPMVAFLQLQTMKTMGLRVKQQSNSAMKIATWLESHPKVERVLYPGLDSFPQKELADKQHRNGLHGGMLWFDVKGGDQAAIKLMDNVQRPWTLCENLGATESIITACAVMTHANMIKEDRLAAGITDGFIRVSCGIEDTDDLISTLAAALEKC